MDNDVKQAYQKSLQLGADPNEALRLAQQIQTQRQSQRGGLIQQTFSQGYSKPNTDQNFLEAVGSTFTRPIERAVKTTGEALNVGLNPAMWKSAFGVELSPEELESVAGYKPKFVNEAEIADTGTILKEGTKTVAGLGSLAIPTGKTLKTALALGTLEGGLRAYSNDQDIVQGAMGGAAGQVISGVALPKAWRWLRKPKGKAVEETTQQIVSGGQIKAPDIEIDEVTNAISPDLRAYPKPDNRAFSYADIWTIPTKRAKDLQPQRTAQFFIDHDIWKTPMELSNTGSLITGSQGRVSGVVREALKKVGDVQVPIMDTIDVLDEGLEMYIEIDDAIANKLKNQLLTKTSKQGDDLANVVLPASRVFELAQQFERIGSQYANKSTYLTDNVRMEQMGDLYKGMAATLVNSLDETIGNEQIIEGIVDDDFFEEIAKITGSQKYADDLAGDLSLLNWRKLQAPWVRAIKMQELTEQASLSSAQKLANKMSIGGLVRSIPGVDTATEVVGSVAKPYLGKATQETKARAILAGAKALGKATGQGAKVGQEAVAVGLDTAGQAIPSVAGASQAEIMQAANSQNWELVKSLIEQLPSDSPYKKPMENLFGSKIFPTGVNGVVEGARQALNKAIPTKATDVLARSAVSNLGSGVLGVNTQATPVEATDGLSQTPQFIKSTTGETLQQIGNRILSEDGQWEWNAQSNDWVRNQEQTGGSFGGYTQDMFKQAVINDLQTTGGKNIDKIIKTAEFIGVTGMGGGKLSQQSQAKLQSINVAKNIVKDYEKSLNEISGGQGWGGSRITGTLKNWAAAVGLDPATATYNSASQATSSLVARSLGETGVLNDNDIKRAASLIPKVTDTNEERRRKITALYQIFSYVEQSVYAAPDAQNSIEDMLIQQRGGL
jgi:hypothetical protein